jgi:hypothetical protein
MATQMAACGYESPRASGLECEADTLAHSTDDLVHLTAKRSVFSAAELEGFNATPDNPMKVIDFLLVGHAEHPISLVDLRISQRNGTKRSSRCYDWVLISRDAYLS